MHSHMFIALIASLALCAADVSHLPLSRTYLPPLAGTGSYSTYASYPSYRGNAYSGGGYYSGSGSGSHLSSGYVTPLTNSGYNSYATVPQYNNYVSPSRTYLPALTGYSSSGYSSGSGLLSPGYSGSGLLSSGYAGSGYSGSAFSGLDTKYAANGGYIY